MKKKMAATAWQAQLRASSNRPRRLRKEDRKRPRKQKTKPPWDDTSSDLTTYKPSAEELARRHDIHKPKPLSERTYLQKYQQKVFQEEKENVFIRKTAFQENVERKKALIKEIFHNQEKELRSVLVETDRTMAEVKDIFGDDPLKFRSIPHVTTAPNLSADENGSILGLDQKGPSRLTALSNSVMRHPALNDFSDESDENSEEDPAQDSFESKLDLDYYKNLLHREQNREYDYDKPSQSNVIQIPINDDPDHALAHRTVDRQSVQELESSSVIVKPSVIVSYPDSQPEKHQYSYSTDVVGGAPGTSQLQGTNSAISDNFLASKNELKGKGIERGASNMQPDGDLQQDSSEKFGKFRQMQQVLNSLEEELSSYENSSGSKKTPDKTESKAYPESNVSALSNVMVKLIQHLKQSEMQVQIERTMYENLLEEFEEQRTLIDALTGDLINTQQQNCSLQEEFERFKLNTTRELEQMKQKFKSL